MSYLFTLPIACGGFQYVAARDRVVDTGGVNNDGNETPKGIHHDVTLSALHFLAPVNASLFTGIDRLTLYESTIPWLGVGALSFFSMLLVQLIERPLPYAYATPIAI